MTWKYITPDDFVLRDKRIRLYQKRRYYEKQYRQTDMLIHAIDNIMQQRIENRKNDRTKKKT